MILKFKFHIPREVPRDFAVNILGVPAPALFIQGAECTFAPLPGTSHLPCWGLRKGPGEPRLSSAASTHRRGDGRGNLVTPAPSHRVAGKGGSRARPAHGCGERGLQAAEPSPSRRGKALDLSP